MPVWHVCGTKETLQGQNRTWRVSGMRPDLGFLVGAGEGNRTLMTSLEGWGSAIELRPRSGCALCRSVPGVGGEDDADWRDGCRCGLRRWSS